MAKVAWVLTLVRLAIARVKPVTVRVKVLDRLAMVKAVWAPILEELELELELDTAVRMSHLEPIAHWRTHCTERLLM